MSYSREWVAAVAMLSLAACGGSDRQAGSNASNTAQPAEPNLAAPPQDVAPPPADNAAAAPAAEPNASPPAAAAPWSPTGYTLNGTEPFWGGTLTGTRLLYKTPENQAGDPVATTAAHGSDQEIYTGTLERRPFVLTLTKGPCSNGMSDHAFAYTAALQVKGESRQGCADPQ